MPASTIPQNIHIAANMAAAFPFTFTLCLSPPCSSGFHQLWVAFFNLTKKVTNLRSEAARYIIAGESLHIETSPGTRRTKTRK
jgi:hypothetical protein